MERLKRILGKRSHSQDRPLRALDRPAVAVTFHSSSTRFAIATGTFGLPAKIGKWFDHQKFLQSEELGGSKRTRFYELPTGDENHSITASVVTMVRMCSDG